VKVNGKEVDARNPDADARGVASLSVPLAGDPRLAPGEENVVEVVAYNADGSLHSRGARAVYKAGGRPAEAPLELWAVVGGTADYIGSESDLRFAARDAEAFSRGLALAAGRLLGEGHVHIRTLSTERTTTAERPTKASLLAAFGEVAQRARPTD